MSLEQKPLPLWIQGQAILNQNLVDMVEATRGLQVNFADPQFTGRRPTPQAGVFPAVEQWVGQITLTPPDWANADGDYTDARYWVKKQCSTADTQGDTLHLMNNLTPNAIDQSGKSAAQQTYTATNLTELPAASSMGMPGDGTHTLPDGTYVYVFGLYSLGSVSGSTITPPAKMYVFAYGSGLKVLSGKVATAWAAGSTYVELTPCKSPTDPTSTGSPNVHALIFSDYTTSIGPPNLIVSVGDIMSYVIVDSTPSPPTCLLLSGPILPQPTADYQVYTSLSGVFIADYVRAH